MKKVFLTLALAVVAFIAYLYMEVTSMDYKPSGFNQDDLP